MTAAIIVSPIVVYNGGMENAFSKEETFVPVVSVEDLLSETLIHHEKGSETLAILEDKLLEHNESLERFHRHICISSFKMIIDLIKSGYGISFVYEVLAKSDPELGIFTLKGEPLIREFNIIYLKYAEVGEKIGWFLD